VLQHQGSSVNPQRQKGPHAHGVVITPDSTKAFVADLGLDKIFIYRLNSGSGSIEPSDPPTASLSPGAGVRHLALDLSGNFLYALSELDSAITVFRCSRHAVRQIQLISALPHDAPPQIGGSEIELDAKGAFLYTSIRGAQNMIAVFAVDRNNGRLTAVQHISSGGRTPRHFAIDPTHSFLFAANQNSHSIAIFAIGADGRLRPTHRFLDDVESPACIVFVELSPLQRAGEECLEPLCVALLTLTLPDAVPQLEGHNRREEHHTVLPDGTSVRSAGRKAAPR